MILTGLAYRECRPAPLFSFSQKVRECYFPAPCGAQATPLSAKQGQQRSGTERAASPGTGLFTGFGVRPQRAKSDFRRSRWKSVLSICGNKCTARQVGISAAQTQHLRKTLVYLQRTCYNKVEVDHYEQYWKLLKTDSK